MSVLIVSDVHLNVADDGLERMAAFTAFLRRVDPARTRRILLMGDLFDFWFEYRHVIFSGYFDVLRALADLRDAGVEFDFACGNHDFWAGRFLRRHLGFRIYQDPVCLDLYGRRVLLVHGDGINPKDRAYRAYKRVARFPLVVSLFRMLHPDWAMMISQGVSRGSRHMSGTKDPATGPEVAPQREFARSALARGDADVVICGHTHYPLVERYPTPTGEGLYINSGDWLRHRSYVVWNGGMPEVRCYPSQPPDEVPDEVAAGKAQRAVQRR